jgi:DNA-3-methyladenine glycosylase II
MTEFAEQLATAAAHLSQDKILAPVITRVGLSTICPHTNYYHELIEGIVGQQLSIAAANAVLLKFRTLFNNQLPTPEQIVSVSVEELRGAGLSRAKATYVQDLAQHIIDGRLQLDKLPDLSNQKIITELTAVKGIGEWTAHMFLIFSLGRLDVLAVGDLGVRNGIKKLYNLLELPNATTIQELAAANHWHPYESIACWYVWQSLKLSAA